jgi:Holliday junction resolvasome RuvABC endonuclease subunit
MIEEELKTTANRCIGIDCSTKSLGWAIFEDDRPVECGEFNFLGANLYERLNHARQMTQALVDEGKLVGDFVGIESAIYVQNMQTAIKLAYVFGAVISVLMQNKMEVVEIAPITWQTAFGVPNLTKEQRAQICKDFPDKSDSWYKSKGRDIRKHHILAVAKKYFSIPGDSDNVGDAVGIAWYVTTSLTKRG